MIRFAPSSLSAACCKAVHWAIPWKCYNLTRLPCCTKNYTILLLLDMCQVICSIYVQALGNVHCSTVSLRGHKQDSACWGQRSWMWVVVPAIWLAGTRNPVKCCRTCKRPKTDSQFRFDAEIDVSQNIEEWRTNRTHVKNKTFMYTVAHTYV